MHFRINDKNCQGTKKERINRRQGCWPELQGTVRFWGLSLVRGCLAMRGLSGWLRFKDTTVDKPPTRLEKGRGGRRGLRAEEEGAWIACRLRKFITDKIDRLVIFLKCRIILHKTDFHGKRYYISMFSKYLNI